MPGRERPYSVASKVINSAFEYTRIGFLALSKRITSLLSFVEREKVYRSFLKRNENCISCSPSVLMASVLR